MMVINWTDAYHFSLSQLESLMLMHD